MSTRSAARSRTWREGDRVAMLSNKAYVQYDVADEGSVVSSLPSALKAFPLPGEPLGCAVNISGEAVGGRTTVAIVGVGFLGALLVQMVKEAGARGGRRRASPFALEIARGWGRTRR